MPARRLRILLVGRGEPERGGIAAFLATVCSSRLARDHDVDFLNLAPTGGARGGQVDRRNLGRTSRDAVAVWRRAKGCDVVHIHSALAPWTTLLRAGVLASIARLRGPGVVLHAHGGRVPLWLTTRPRRAAARAALALATRVIAVSTGGRDALTGILGADRVVLVRNGVDVSAFEPATGGHQPPRVLYVGVLTERKGVRDLLDASEELDRRGVPHELWLVGGTPDEGPEAEAAIRAAAGPRTRFVGQIAHEEMPATYREADIFVLPSWWEASPLSVLEAMAAGLPVVASRVGDVEQMVDDGQTGFVVDAKRPDQLAEALGRLLQDGDLRSTMGAAARIRVVAAHDLARAVDAVERVYEDAAATARGRRT